MSDAIFEATVEDAKTLDAVVESQVKIRATATEEQLLYANILEKGMFMGLLLMCTTFVVYLAEILPAIVPKHLVAGYWNQPVKDYLARINAEFLGWSHPPTGWSWINLIHKGDFANFLPVAMLSGVTIFCYAAIVPGLFRRGDKAFGVMAVTEVLILVLAASGMLAVGH